ncbi:ankyrin [Lophium mytilinum]|uniref:Ankyrin n=1 Tax=Lophium mytilinum TaxID=390894 RepID=A0A6A6QBK8_9PEZI|nr:ankyrin [Lophium mytilinum]
MSAAKKVANMQQLPVAKDEGRMKKHILARQLVLNIKSPARLEVMRLLEDCNADPDVGINWDNTYIFPLTEAISMGFAMAETLLIKGAKLKPCHDILHHNMPPALSHPITVAIANRQTEMVHLMLAYGVPVNFTWDVARDGMRTPFIEALSRGDLKLVRVLLDHGADVFQSNLTQLSPGQMSRYTSRFDPRQAQLLGLLSQCKALHLWPYPSGLALLHATGIGNRELMEHLVSDGFVETKLANENRLTALHLAAGAEGGDIIEFLLAKGASVESLDTYGTTPLMHAVFYGNLAAVERLLSFGATANDFFRRNEYLPVAVPAVPFEYHFDRIAKTLSGFAQFREFEWSAIQVASHRGFCKILTVLLKAGGDPYYQSIDGKTALDVAINNRHWRVVNDLLQLGVNFNATKPSVARLLEETSDDYNSEAACLLVERGANPSTMFSDIKFKGLERNTENLAILDEATKALFLTAEPRDPKRESKFCSACSRLFERPPISFETVLEGCHDSRTSCAICALARDSIRSLSSLQRWDIRFSGLMNVRDERFRIYLCGKSHEVQQFPGQYYNC